MSNRKEDTIKRRIARLRKRSQQSSPEPRRKMVQRANKLSRASA